MTVTTNTYINWKDLIVTGEDGVCGTLGKIVSDELNEIIDSAEFDDNGVLAQWPQYWLSVDGNPLDDNGNGLLNNNDVDWDGLADAVKARQN
jgi:hypothetical protein